MPNKLIGTGANQVPVNGMLGELAFQSKENVNFTGGTGKLSKLDIEAISTQLGVTAIDVFVYDTSKDSDGGAWRKRCQNTSWYNEALGTDIRGTRKEFPAVAVLVTTSSSLLIYDADDSALPLWMSFSQGGTWPSNNIIGQNSSGLLTCVSAINGRIVVGFSGDGTKIINFINEKCEFYWSTYYRLYKGNIAQRNQYIGWFDSASPYGAFASTAVNDVATIVLSNAPIDATTGLPVPTIAVATNGSASVIKHDGTVVNMSSSPTAGVSFDRAYNVLSNTNDINSTFATYSTAIGYATSTSGRSYYYGANGFTTPATMGAVSTPYSNFVIAARDGEIAVASSSNSGYGKTGLNIIAENYSNKANGMVNYITSKYNTGWMIGDIKGAWLSDTAQETVVGAELVTNGTFDSNITGWTSARGATLSYASGAITVSSGSTFYGASAYQAIACVVGKTYTATATCLASNSITYASLKISTNSEVVGQIAGVSSTATNVPISVTFVATQSTMYLHVEYNPPNGYATFDNVSCRLADPDRSVNNKGLQVVGSITKTPVATGADLVAYSGMNGTNYLMQQYNSALDFGTGDFSIIGWAKIDDTANYNTIVSRQTALGTRPDNSWMLIKSSSGPLSFWYGVTSSNNWIQHAIGTKPVGGIGWFHFAAVRSSGTFKIYINGALDVSSANTANYTLASANLYIGAEYPFASQTSNGIAMLRISATAPSDSQISKMYNDEKVLFQDNAKATLYGTSDAVPALAYDEVTNLLHVGTSSGRSVFHGLRRIDNTTTAVSASISASNGLVAEQ